MYSSYMPMILSEIEKLKLENSNLRGQVAEYREIVAELSEQLKKYKRPIEIKETFVKDKT